MGEDAARLAPQTQILTATGIHRARFQNTERGRPRPQQRTYDRQFSKSSNDLAIWKLLRPRTGALRCGKALLHQQPVIELRLARGDGVGKTEVAGRVELVGE